MHGRLLAPGHARAGLARVLLAVLTAAVAAPVVQPLPSAFPLLSAGLNEEPDSRIDSAEAYVLRKGPAPK